MILDDTGSDMKLWNRLSLPSHVGYQTRRRDGGKTFHVCEIALGGPRKKFQFFSKNPKFSISRKLVLASPYGVVYGTICH